MKLVNVLLIGVIGLGVIVWYFVSEANSKPSDKIVKNIANYYRINYSDISDIKIVKSYEDKGKIVYILNIKRSICEMPMIKIDEEWIATGISCQG